jgi:hypothetical protein
MTSPGSWDHGRSIEKPDVQTQSRTSQNDEPSQLTDSQPLARPYAQACRNAAYRLAISRLDPACFLPSPYLEPA